MPKKEDRKGAAGPNKGNAQVIRRAAMNRLAGESAAGHTQIFNEATGKSRAGVGVSKSIYKKKGLHLGGY